ncbi:aldehyde dehydrogenase family protein, partial [Aeromicrobium alkaliterrae]|uniref:aldehyde dehydrogenase family protein n=1 Tax=Aeromicrobium alkaliterrae TaxID=302168 RepID=UPI0031D012FC
AGNCMIWKPSPDTPFTGALILECLIEAGLPPGVLSYLTGTSSEVGEALVRHPGIHAITFTGSTAVGRAIELAGAQSGKRVQAEMGGVNPLVVLADADVAVAAAAAAEGAFGSTGQKCTATRRALVESSVYDEFVEIVCASAASRRLGDAQEAQTELGPLVSERARALVAQQVRELAAAGARVVCGGAESPQPHLADGWYFEPTVIVDVPRSCELLDHEIFGPVLIIERVADLADALGRIAQSEYGLAAGLFSDSHRSITQFAAAVEAGLLAINLPTTGVEPQASFGGLKSSGNGSKEVGQDALQFYTDEVTIALAVS